MSIWSAGVRNAAGKYFDAVIKIISCHRVPGNLHVRQYRIEAIDAPRLARMRCKFYGSVAQARAAIENDVARVRANDGVSALKKYWSDFIVQYKPYFMVVIWSGTSL